MRRWLVILCIVLLLAGVVAGQDAHYVYPFSVECPEGLVSRGDTVSIAAKFQDGYTGDRYLPTYNWSINAGSLVEGQGTPAIKVRVGERGGEMITITLVRTFMEPHFPGVQRDATCVIAVQEMPHPRMIDEFRTAGSNCEEGFARLDNFLVELNNDPTARGVIILHGDVRDTKAAARREQQLRFHFRFRNVDRTRVTFIRGMPRENGTTQFWLVPPGANDPDVIQAPPVVEKPPTEAYIHSAEFLDGVPGCSGYIYDVGAYADVLRSLPGSRGRVVISETSRARFNRKLREIMSEITAKGVARSRITSVYRYVKPDRALEAVELWVVPLKK